MNVTPAGPMIQAAGKAIFETHAGPWSGQSWDEIGSNQEAYRRQARAVLLAIREPSHAMCVAGDPDKFAPGDSEAIWTAMIDELLFEPA